MLIPSMYAPFFSGMSKWTADYAAATGRRYSALQVGGELQVMRGEDVEPVFEFHEPTIEEIEADEENTENIPVETYPTQEELNSGKTEEVSQSPPHPNMPVSPNRDGWTDETCPVCYGESNDCIDCRGSGKLYLAELDERTFA